MQDAKKQKATVMHTQGFSYQPFVFEDFSRPAPKTQPVDEESVPEVQAPAAEPVKAGYSEEELQAACAEAEARGRAQGLEQARAEHEAGDAARNAGILTLLEGLAARMDEEVSAFAAARESMRAEMAKVVLLMARKLAGNALDAQPLGAVEGMVTECLTMLAGEPRLSIAVCPQLEEPLRGFVAQVQREGQVVTVTADPALQPGDCRIQWPGGKAHRDQEELRRDIEGIIERALSVRSSDNKE